MIEPTASNGYGVPRHHRLSGTRRYVTAATELVDAPAPVHGVVQQHLHMHSDHGFRQVHFIRDVPAGLIERLEETFSISFMERDEAFIIEATEATARVYATSERGLLYGAIALIRMTHDAGIGAGLIYDYPACTLRALRIHLPGSNDVTAFQRLVELALYYRYNTLVIEVGGGMEYQRHPEINDGWVEYCGQLRTDSNSISRFRAEAHWHKNSIHSEVGGGSYLTQSEVRELLAYCRQRCIDVVPEVPSLSHSDYLLTRHPELAERSEDRYPDTYCPSTEASYDLLFDVLDEVLDVFDPRTLLIGHDEWYSIGRCGRCRDKPAAELFAADVHRIHRYLADRGVKTAMWGDKLLDATDEGGRSCGGARIEMGRSTSGEPLEVMPATHTAVELMPNDVLIFHWYWSLGKHHDETFAGRKLTFAYGNFYGYDFPDWTTRHHQANGIVVSHWSYLAEPYLQRHSTYANLAYSAYLAWHPDHNDDDHDAVLHTMFNDLYEYRRRLSLAEGAQFVEVLHTTDHYIEHTLFHDSAQIDTEKFRLGCYLLRYASGARVEIPIIYGENISHSNVSWDRDLVDSKDRYETDALLLTTALMTLAQRHGNRTYYRYLIPNPRPDDTIIDVELQHDAVLVKEVAIH